MKKAILLIALFTLTFSEISVSQQSGEEDPIEETKDLCSKEVKSIKFILFIPYVHTETVFYEC